jgi:hypothetical protein
MKIQMQRRKERGLSYRSSRFVMFVIVQCNDVFPFKWLSFFSMFAIVVTCLRLPSKSTKQKQVWRGGLGSAVPPGIHCTIQSDGLFFELIKFRHHVVLFHPLSKPNLKSCRFAKSVSRKRKAMSKTSNSWYYLRCSLWLWSLLKKRYFGSVYRTVKNTCLFPVRVILNSFIWASMQEWYGMVWYGMVVWNNKTIIKPPTTIVDT